MQYHYHPKYFLGIVCCHWKLQGTETKESHSSIKFLKIADIIYFRMHVWAALIETPSFDQYGGDFHSYSANFSSASQKSISPNTLLWLWTALKGQIGPGNLFQFVFLAYIFKLWSFRFLCSLVLCVLWRRIHLHIAMQPSSLGQSTDWTLN